MELQDKEKMTGTEHRDKRMGTEIHTITHLIATNFYGGPEKQIVEHLVRLRSKQYRGIVLSFIEGETPNEILKRSESAGLEHYGIPMSGPVDVSALRKTIRAISDTRTDLLCVHGYKSIIFGWCIKMSQGIPVIAFSRGYTAENKKVAFYEWMERRFIGRLDGIISVSEGQRRRLAELGVKTKREWVVHNAALINGNQAELHPSLRDAVCGRLDVPIEGKLVVSAGRLSPEKGHVYLVEAAQYFKNDPNVFFIFCGEGACRSMLEDRAKELGVISQCRFAGFRKDLDDIFYAMDIMALPSLTEGLPNVVLEAFAHAKPVVATGVGGVPEIVEDDENGFVVPPRDVPALAKAIEKLLSDRRLSRSMGKEGYRKVKEQFTFDAQLNKLIKIYSLFLGQAV